MKKNKTLILMMLGTLLFLSCQSVQGKGNGETVSRERRRPKSYHLHHTIAVDASAQQIYGFITNQFPDYYTDLAEGHLEYTVLTGMPITEGSVIRCHETAGPQEVFHQYRVMEVQPDESLYYYAENSSVKIYIPNGDIKENSSNTHVYYDIIPVTENSSNLSLTIVIEMPSRTMKIMGSIFGAKKLWTDHLEEELTALGTIIEDYYHG